MSISADRQTDTEEAIIPPVAAVALPVIYVRDLSAQTAAVSVWVEILSPAVDGGGRGKEKE